MNETEHKPKNYSCMFIESILKIPEQCITLNEINEIEIIIMKSLEKIQNLEN
jgi:hypothetical protein